MRAFVLFMLLALGLFAASDFNVTLENADAATYEKLLHRIKTSGAQNDDRKLQEALLYKLINLSHVEKPKPLKLEIPKDEEAYRDLTARYGRWLLQKAKLQANLDSLSDKLEAVNQQLARKLSGDDNASGLTLRLERAFYRKGEALAKARLDAYEAALAKAPDLFVQALRHVRFDENRTQERLTEIEKELSRVERKIQQTEVEKERLDLLGRTEAARQTVLKLHRLHDRKLELLNEKLLELFVRFSIALQKKSVKEVFSLQKRMHAIVTQAYPPDVQKGMAQLVRKMETEVLGRAATIRGATLEEIESAAHLFWQKATEPLFFVNKTPISAVKLLLALLIFVFGFIVGQFYKRGVKRLTEHSASITPSTQTLLANLGYYLIVIAAFFITLKVLGINLTSIALVAGALSVGIGFGLQNVVSNFVSGLILMFERSIKIGDYVELDDNLRGRISDIRMRSTTITTNDNIDVIVPNQDLIQNRVINWTMNDRLRRFKIPFGVAYGTDADKVETVILEAVRTSGFTDIYESGRRKTRVIMTGMGDSSVNFELFVWIQGREILYPRRTESRFLRLIYKTLNIHGIEIPFPQRDIHIRSVDGEIPLRIDEIPAGNPSLEDKKNPSEKAT